MSTKPAHECTKWNTLLLHLSSMVPFPHPPHSTHPISALGLFDPSIHSTPLNPILFDPSIHYYLLCRDRPLSSFKSLFLLICLSTQLPSILFSVFLLSTLTSSVATDLFHPLFLSFLILISTQISTPDPFDPVLACSPAATRCLRCPRSRSTSPSIR